MSWDGDSRLRGQEIPRFYGIRKFITSFTSDFLLLNISLCIKILFIRWFVDRNA
jgi:hypothetical protein